MNGDIPAELARLQGFSEGETKEDLGTNGVPTMGNGVQGSVHYGVQDHVHNGIHNSLQNGVQNRVQKGGWDGWIPQVDDFSCRGLFCGMSMERWNTLEWRINGQYMVMSLECSER